MKHDPEFRLECFAWLHNIRGPRFIRRLRRLVDWHGPTRALELLTRPTMSDELIEVHAAMIKHVVIETQITSRSAECGNSLAETAQPLGQRRQRVQPLINALPFRLATEMAGNSAHAAGGVLPVSFAAAAWASPN